MLPRAEPLWLGLREHHAALSPTWRESLLARTFAQRCGHLIDKAAKDGLLVLLATSHQKEIGQCICTITPDDHGEVDSLYVMPEHRGRGVATGMMTVALDWLRRRPLKSIALDVLSGNDPAIRFYERFGFKDANRWMGPSPKCVLRAA